MSCLPLSSVLDGSAVPAAESAGPAAAGAARRAALRLAGGDALWLADQMASAPAAARPTGFAALDAELPGGGWPHAGLTELLLEAPGSGELRLLSPAFARPGQTALWIAPPFTPYAPALRALGWSLPELHWIAPADEADAAWAAEQALRSRAVSAVFWWAGSRCTPAMLRRLHLAAQEGGLPLVAFRPWGAAAQSSPAPLRLGCQAAPAGRLAVSVLKRRGPACAAPLWLTPAPAFIAKAGARLRPQPQPSPIHDHALVRPRPALAVA